MSACSKAPGKTEAKLKLSLAGIVNFSSGVGTGGAMLFGRSAAGELFGKNISALEETLDIPNGDWMFYAVMWEKTGSEVPLNGKVYCAKTPAKLTGVEIALNMNLTNSNCADNEFSGGKHFTQAGNIRFAQIFLDECDDISASTQWYCQFGNQGSAVSYRFKFQNFKKGPGTPFFFGGDAYVSRCSTFSELRSQGLTINFPIGLGVTPFVGSVEMFLGSSTCDPSEAKGMHQVTFERGLGESAGPASKTYFSNQACSSTIPAGALGADLKVQKEKCEAYLGSWSGSACTSLPFNISRFVPNAAECGASLIDTQPAIKHLVSIPRFYVCSRYENQTSVIGAHPFAGGDGTLGRPYKICTEWQLNQIGETTALSSYKSSSYKLMNDLDMNKTDMRYPAAKPNCAGVAGSVVDDHHNLNSLDVLTTNCTALNAPIGFSGTFFGGWRVIRNARIQAETAEEVGFIRRLNGNGRVLNLSFENAEVKGLNNVGTIAGLMASTTNVIEDIKIDGLDLEGRSQAGLNGSFVGGIVGNITGPNAEVRSVRVLNADIRGRHHIGGIVGQSYGTLKKAQFRGKIISHEMDTGSVGGLVGVSGSGTYITDSFSEGLIDTSSQYVGGIAGSLGGTINNAYSTMILMSRYSAAKYLGGIAGDASSGTISNVYFDGDFRNFNGGTPTYNGIFPLGSTATNCYSSWAANSSGCTMITSANLRSTTPAFTTPTDWVTTAGSLPRLTWEQRQCSLAANHALPAVQASAGRGSALNPIIICNVAQLSALAARASTEHYLIGNDLRLHDFTVNATISGFNGQLDGGGKILYGWDRTYTIGDHAMSYEGIFRNVGTSASIKNLKLYANTMINVAGTDDTGNGLLAGRNLGTISDIEFYANKIHGHSKTGTVVGTNSNSLKNITVDNGEVAGELQIGGIAGYNDPSGTLTKASSHATVNPQGPIFTSIGGVVGLNAGNIDQVQFKGMMKSSTNSSNANNLRAGGIVGHNLGTISNALFGSYGRLEFANDNYLGGLVGENSGNLINSLSLGKIVYSYSGATATGSYFQPIVGREVGGSIGSYVFALENNIGSLKTTATSTVDCVGDGSTPCTVNTSISSLADQFELVYGNSNNQLSGFIPMSPSSSTFTYTGSNFTNPASLNFYESLVPSTPTRIKSVTDMSTLSTFCPSGFSSSDGSGYCTGGFNIAEMNGVGNDRILDYYFAVMSKQTPPANSPIWEFDDEEGPRLLQLDF